MQSDTARVHSNALHILTIATGVVGFGLFEISFQNEIKELLALLGRSEESSLSFSSFLSFMKLYTGASAIFVYFSTFVGVGRLLVRDNLLGRDLVMRRGPFVALGFLVGLVFVLFVIQQVPGVESFGGEREQASAFFVTDPG